MTTETANDARRTWETYAAAWKATDTDAKARALSASVSSSCIYRDPTSELSGHDALIEHMHGFHAQVPGAYFRTKYFLEHHGRSIARWDMVVDVPAGEPTVLSEGMSYGEYDAGGKLVTMTGFFDVAPR